MATSFTIVNAALTRTGNDVITEFNDGSAGGTIANNNYAQIVATALTAHPWKFATKTQALAQIDGEPDPPWTYVYTLPGDVLMLRVVTVAGMPIPYEQQFNKLLCDYGSDSDVIAKYTFSASEAYWPGTFVEAITQHLEAMFLRGIGERYDEAEAREKSARAMMQLAKLEDSKRASPIDPFVSPTLQARTGIGNYTRPPLTWR